MNNIKDITIRIQCQDITEETEEEILFVVNKILMRIPSVRTTSYFNESLKTEK